MYIERMLIMQFKKWLFEESIRLSLNKNDDNFIQKFISLVNAQKNPFSRNEYYYNDENAIVKFEMSSGFLKPGSIHISALHVIPNKTGAGTRFMNKLVNLADQTNTTLELDAVPLKTNEKIPLKALVSFYRSFGFNSVKGFDRSTMIRNPNSI